MDDAGVRFRGEGSGEGQHADRSDDQSGRISLWQRRNGGRARLRGSSGQVSASPGLAGEAPRTDWPSPERSPNQFRSRPKATKTNRTVSRAYTKAAAPF